MAWTVPGYSKSQVDAAGRALVRPVEDYDLDDYLGTYIPALDVLNNWRSAHSFPLNTFQVTLRRKAASVDANSVVAQRIKRLSSIELKLKRFPGLRLSQIQDIGGCRAIVTTVSGVRDLERVYKASDIRHTLVRTDDYIANPQKSGYRGIHLIYRYNSHRGGQAYNGLQIEMQLRSQLQHAWATAVETVGTFTRQALKSSQGHDDYLRFFELMGTVLAIQENSPPVHNTPTDRSELVVELKKFAEKIDIVSRLTLFGSALNIIDNAQASGAHYFLLDLNPAENEIKVMGFSKSALQRAQNEYLEIERRNVSQSGRDAVLVSVDSTAALKRAYPNYFLDTRIFLDVVRDSLEGRPVEIPEIPPLPS